MEPTLLDGDYVFVSKTSYGVRLPRSLYDIPWLNLLTYLYPFNLLNHGPTQQYKRLYSKQKVNRGDIVIFNIPVYQKEFGIKRCTKIPTDTVAYLKNCQVSILPYHGYSINSKIDSLGLIERRIFTHYCIKSRDSLLWFNHYYYFLEGDNKNNSTDSRTWGAIQDDHIVGKAHFVIFSKDIYNQFRRKRFFKQIE